MTKTNLYQYLREPCLVHVVVQIADVKRPLTGLLHLLKRQHIRPIRIVIVDFMFMRTLFSRIESAGKSSGKK
jgi:hypothetical protein